MSKKRKNYQLFCVDAVEWLKSLPDTSADLIITDPPYESLEKHRKVGITTRLKNSKASSNEWFNIFPNKRFKALFKQCFRVLKKDRHLYLFCDNETMFVVKRKAEKAGFTFRNKITWDKILLGMGYSWRYQTENILFFSKGKRKLNDLSLPNIIREKMVKGGYPTEKPVAVSELLTTQSSEPGELVVDPFMGSGSVGLAALRNFRKFKGCDLCTEAVEITKERLENHRKSVFSFWSG